ncbi:DHA2 family efflux MFS transporter permease subunit [Tumebacillus flagellatus]|uniref:Major facilitator transporter n=1 Tax=Tumebacillus flagellatus TaxID=1157490 RepID=A0A074LXN8_9BACL|nr:DHA2 family efflux MFS transporter permease subunit [Tumebacillus flagellatus]KEO84888.1 major facilitator transporter [Tumebacillus flagellatus]
MSETSQTQGSDVKFWPVMIALFCGAFLTVLSTSTINVAVPVLIEHFHSDLSTIQWALTGFLLATGTTAPICGYLGERFSYKRLYLGSLIGFTLFSLLCAVAWNDWSLVAFRTMQGACNGLVMPATMTIIFQVVPKPRQPIALSLWSLSSMLGPAIGPTLAGWLMEYSWHWMFLMNVPIGLLSIILTQRLVPYYRLNVPKKFDLPGLITCVAGSLSLLIAFSKGNAWGWGSGKTLGLLIFGAVMVVLFFVRELRTDVPLLYVRVFQNKRYNISLIILCIITLSLYSGTYLTPLFLQNVLLASPLDAGLILLPASIAMALMTPLAGRLYSKIGPTVLLTTGILFIALGTWMMAQLTPETSKSYVMLWMIVRNIGIALSFTPAQTSAMEEIPRNVSGYASSITNWLRNVVGSFAIAMFTSMLGARETSHSAELALQQAGDAKSIALHSFTLSMNDVYLLATFIALAGIPVCFFIRKKRQAHNLPTQALKA